MPFERVEHQRAKYKLVSEIVWATTAAGCAYVELFPW